MRFFKVISKWKERNRTSDIKRVRVTSSGAFYMKSEDLFDDKKETLDLLEKLDKSVVRHKEVNNKHFAHSE